MSQSVPAVSKAALYGRLSLYYFFYFAALGALLPYWGLYLQQQGYNAQDIGTLIAIISATRIIAPYLWGWLADYTGQRLRTIRFAALAAVISFLGVYQADSLWQMAFVMVLFCSFWNAGLPQFEAATLLHLGEDHHRYSSIRLWGSVGFIVAVILLGPLLEHYGEHYLPHILLLLFLVIWLSTLWVPDGPGSQASAGAAHGILNIIKQPAVIVILLSCVLMQLSFGPYYTFFSIYLEAHNYSTTWVGILWAVGVLAEIGIFLLMHRLMPRFGVKLLLLFCFLSAAVRWWLTAVYIDWLWLIVLVQCLHAISFGVFHAVMIHLIHRYFSGPYQGRGQALYSSLSFGAGGALGAYASGYSWQQLGASTTFIMAAIIAVLGAGLVLFGLRTTATD